jgi:hypothetical protein
MSDGQATISGAAPGGVASAPGRVHWLDDHVMAIFIGAALAAYGAAIVLWGVQSQDLVDLKGKPLGYDFITFWSVSHLTLGGEPEAAYFADRIFEAGRAAVPASTAQFIWSYPPTYHLVVLPLALLPYTAAYALWCLVSLAVYLAVTPRLAPSRMSLWIALAFPGCFLNLLQGQNGLITTALLAGALLLLERRPLLAGILIGLMSFKPQFGLLIPIALVCGGHWRVFLSAAVTTVAFAAASWLAFGTAPWLAFFANIEFAVTVLETGALPFAKMPSLFAALRNLGVGIGVANAAQIALALAVAAIVAMVWLRRAPLPLAGAVLAAGSLLVSPHINDHDLALLAIPIALLAVSGWRDGWRRGERELLLFAWVVPMAGTPLTVLTGVQVGFLATLAVFAMAANRALRPQAGLASTPDTGAANPANPVFTAN